MANQTTVIVRGARKRPPLAVTNDADRASRIIARIQRRCPEVTPADLVLVARVINKSERARAPRPRKRSIPGPDDR